MNAWVKEETFLTVVTSLVPVVSRPVETFSKEWLQNERITVLPSAKVDGNIFTLMLHPTPKRQGSPVGSMTFANKEKTHQK